MEKQTPNLFSAENMKCVELNNLLKANSNKKFTNGLANAREILTKLEKSLEKSRKYESELLKCKTCNVHSRCSDDGWDLDMSDENDYKSNTGTDNMSPTNGVDMMTESWSAMFIISLQYKYEDLSNRYKALLEAFDKRCDELSNRDAALLKMQHRVNRSYSKLINAHKTVLVIGEKYLALRRKMNEQKLCYEEKIIKLQWKLNEVIDTAELARIEFDAQLTQCLSEERDSCTAMLLQEIKKCNNLFLENLRLNMQLEETKSENASWK